MLKFRVQEFSFGVGICGLGYMGSRLQAVFGRVCKGLRRARAQDLGGGGEGGGFRFWVWGLGFKVVLGFWGFRV